MEKRWTIRPQGSNWGEFGEDDQCGRMNLITPQIRLQAFQEVITGDVFCLSLPLDKPGGQVLNAHRCAPIFKPVTNAQGHKIFNFALNELDQRLTDVSSDEAVLLYSQYSTQWDSFSHKGSWFDVDGEGQAKKVFYNGWSIVDKEGHGEQGELGAKALSIAKMAEKGVQGRGVMIEPIPSPSIDLVIDLRNFEISKAFPIVYLPITSDDCESLQEYLALLHLLHCRSTLA